MPSLLIAALTPRPGEVRLRVTDYPALATPGGSVQLAFSSLTAPMTINRVSPSRIVALDATCTHAGCTVGKFDPTLGLMRCPCHGSRYDLEGRVLPDQPAPDDLARFDSEFDAATGRILVRIPGLAFGLKTAALQAPEADRRIALSVPVSAGSTYELHWSPSLDDEFVPIPFALSEDGPLTQWQYSAVNNLSLVLHAAAPGERGFYSVVLVLTEN